MTKTNIRKVDYISPYHSSFPAHLLDKDFIIKAVECFDFFEGIGNYKNPFIGMINPKYLDNKKYNSYAYFEVGSRYIKRFDEIESLEKSECTSNCENFQCDGFHDIILVERKKVKIPIKIKNYRHLKKYCKRFIKALKKGA